MHYKQRYQLRKKQYEGQVGPCVKCKKVLTYFSLNYCRDCKREQDRLSARNAIKRNLIELYKYKDKPCIRCNEKFHPVAMECHHRDRATKKKPLQGYLNYSTSKFKKELEKCDVICSNCHQIQTFEEKDGTSLYYPHEVLREVLETGGFLSSASSSSG